MGLETLAVKTFVVEGSAPTPKKTAERDSWMQQRASGGNFAPTFVIVTAPFIRSYSSFVFCLSLVPWIPQEIWVPKEDYWAWYFIDKY
jgi:hypothetical protein